MRKADVKILVLRLDDGKVSPLAWTRDGLSKRQIRQATRRFKKDADVLQGELIHHSRLYSTASDAMAELPQYL